MINRDGLFVEFLSYSKFYKKPDLKYRYQVTIQSNVEPYRRVMMDIIGD